MQVPEFTYTLCYAAHIRGSFSWTSCRFFCLWRRPLKGAAREVAINVLFEDIETFYNRERLHETLGYVSPVRYAEQRIVP